MSQDEINVIEEIYTNKEVSKEDYQKLVRRYKKCPYSKNYEDCPIWSPSGDITCLSNKCEVKEK